MNLPSKITIALLISAVLGIFTFHWFFADNAMPINDCLSLDNCVYNASQIIIPEIKNILFAILFAVSFATFAISRIMQHRMAKRIPGRMFLEWKTEGFFSRFISWLKILEKRDPQAASFLAARIL